MMNYLIINARQIKVPANVIHSYHKDDEKKHITLIKLDQNNSNNNNLNDIIEDVVEDNTEDDAQTLIKALLKHHLNQMKPKYQIILNLRYNEDMTLNEIGLKLNITKEAVRQQHNKAIIQFRHLFKVK